MKALKEISGEGMYSVYGVIDPRDGLVFYIGQSINPRARIHGSHKTDSISCVYPRYQELLKLGMKVRYVVYGMFQTRHEALRLERMLIKTLPGLCNYLSTAVHMSDNRYPINDVDREMLSAGIALGMAMLLPPRGEVCQL